MQGYAPGAWSRDLSNRFFRMEASRRMSPGYKAVNMVDEMSKRDGFKNKDLYSCVFLVLSHLHWSHSLLLLLVCPENCALCTSLANF